ncbi:hypothetical protein AB8O38_05275 [Saccharomonospora xinjiangensis]|uniref:hypothetical protein n=1 Tax=Saccharomonospora xinjiangensis TaxID=75294 RepID=UPI00350EAF8D
MSAEAAAAVFLAEQPADIPEPVAAPPTAFACGDYHGVVEVRSQLVTKQPPRGGCHAVMVRQESPRRSATAAGGQAGQP